MWHNRVTIVVLCLGVVAATRSGHAGASTCKIQFPLNSDYVSAFYETVIQGKGCFSNATTNSTAEVHVISLLNAGPMYRNDLAEVNLQIKSRYEDQAYMEPFIYILNSRQPVRWKIRTELLFPNKKKHIFVIPPYSSVRLVKGKHRKQLFKRTMPIQTQMLMAWVKKEYNALTSYTELQRGNQIVLSVGLEKHATNDCVIQENSSQKLGVTARYEQPQISSGCIVSQTDVSRVAYIIELEQATTTANSSAAVEVELDIRSRSKKRVQKDFWLVLKSPNHVNWKVRTHKLQGYIDIVANSFVDMTGIKMDPVGVRTEDITDTKQDLIRWVEFYIGPVAMYSKIKLANKIKLVLPDTAVGAKNHTPKQKTQIDPFSVPSYFKAVVKGVLRTRCDGSGEIAMAIPKSVMRIFKMSRKQLTLLGDQCGAEGNKTDMIFQTQDESCGTSVIHKDGRTFYSNAIVLHREEMPVYHHGSGNGMINDIIEDEETGSGTGIGDMDTTYIDDEDLTHSSDKIEIHVQCSSVRQNKIPKVNIPSNRNVTYLNKSSDVVYNLVLFKSRHYTDPTNRYPMAIPANSRVYVKASIEAENSLRVQVQNCWLSSSMDQQAPPKVMLIRDNCLIDKSVQWEFYGPLQHITQNERFSFLISDTSPYYFLRCQLSVCRIWEKKRDKKNIPQCLPKKDKCDDKGPIALLHEVVRGPLHASESPYPVTDTPNNVVQGKPEDHIKVIPKKPTEDKSSQKSNQSKQTIIVEGLKSGTVIGIAFAAFFIGVLLVAALWFIHTHTGPIKHAVASRSVLDGSGESTPMSTAPLQINS